jgi:3-oxoacyl-[acyl-carrier-protein] synthase III
MRSDQGTSIGLSGVAGVLAPGTKDLTDLAAAGLVSSPVATLAGFGFERVHVCDAHCSVEDLAVDAARAALSDAGLQPHDVDLLVYASARAESQLKGGARGAGVLGSAGTAGIAGGAKTLDDEVMRGFRYSSAWLQHTLELHGAEVMAVAQQGCATMFSALRVARGLLVAEPERQHVLCVGVDALPPGANREVLYNVISDAACAAVVSRGCTRERWIGFQQVSKGYYWDPSACGPEIVAAYFPTAKAVIEQLLIDHDLEPADIDLVIPTGVNKTSWDILLRLVGIPRDRLQTGLRSYGHTIAADSFLNLEALRVRDEVARGSRLLLFAYGFGSSWCGLLLEH